MMNILQGVSLLFGRGVKNYGYMLLNYKQTFYQTKPKSKQMK